MRSIVLGKKWDYRLSPLEWARLKRALISSGKYKVYKLNKGAGMISVENIDKDSDHYGNTEQFEAYKDGYYYHMNKYMRQKRCDLCLDEDGNPCEPDEDYFRIARLDDDPDGKPRELLEHQVMMFNQTEEWRKLFPIWSVITNKWHYEIDHIFSWAGRYCNASWNLRLISHTENMLKAQEEARECLAQDPDFYKKLKQAALDGEEDFRIIFKGVFNYEEC